MNNTGAKESEYRQDLNQNQFDQNNVYLSGAKNMADAIR